MKIFVGDTYEMMSKQAADDVVELMRARKQPLICTASGASPAGLYKEIITRAADGQLITNDWFFLGLDEWVGLNGDDEGSCRDHLNHDLFNPLQTEQGNICFFDGRSGDLQSECERAEMFIEQHGGIDVVVLGIGMNGHVGMNEPGTDPHLRSHVAELDPITQQVGQKYFKKEQKLTSGITLGIATIMAARTVILMVSGQHKAEITQQIIENEISEKLPATLLRRHPGLKIYLDAEAASKMIKS
jgi:glucosamine-6-phosphate isomerase